MRVCIMTLYHLIRCVSMIQNYRERNAFIVTQAPMANTVGDFWRMIWETKSAAIVMLTELTENDQVCGSITLHREHSLTSAVDVSL